MITEVDNPQERSDERATWLWAVLVSGFINLLTAMLIAWGISLRMQALQAAQDRPEETFMVASSSIHIAQHSHPIPQQRNPEPVQAQKSQPQRAQPKSVQREAATPQPTAQPTELAKIVPSAPPQPRSAPKKQNAGSLAEQLAQQQVAFQHEAQQLNSQRNPLSVATIDPAQRQSATKTYKMNFSGNEELAGRGEGFVFPLRRWIDNNGNHCYYVQYQWLYPTGGTEVGNVPWPFCYPPNGDLIARGLRQIPFNEPPPGYQLPAGTFLYPIEKDVYQAWLSEHG
jgi:hypothetical protein